MKKLRSKLLASKAYGSVLRFAVLSCLLLGFSGVAWGDPTYACGGVHTWHSGDKDYYLNDNKCGFFGSEDINNKDFGNLDSFAVDFVVFNNDNNTTYENGLVGYQIDGGEWKTAELDKVGDYNYNGTNYAKYQVYVPISNGLAKGKHTLNFYFRVPHVNNDWYLSNNSANYTFYFTLNKGEEPLPDELPDGIICDDDFSETLFFEDFGKLSDERARKETNLINNEAFVTSYSYVGDDCKNAIKQPGDYAIVANSQWHGCSDSKGTENLDDDTDYGDHCYCAPNKQNCRLWYRDVTDHTGNGLGGMVQFDCKGGNDDLLYQRTIKGVCPNTLVNFSAYITKANKSNIDPIGARFILRKGGADGEIIGRKDIKNIDLNNDPTLDENGWKHVFAMFNSGDLDAEGQITVQLLNLANYGQQGNDLLLDDLELRICRPDASLTAKYEGESTTKVETICGVGSDEVQLVANVNAQSFTKTYYLWQKKVGNGKWVPLTEQEGSGENKSTLNVTLTSTHTEYRVVVANSKEDAEKADTESVCGMAAITNIVSVGCNNMDLSIESTKASICENDNGEYIIKATNNTSATLTNAQITLLVPKDKYTDVKIVTPVGATSATPTETTDDGVEYDKYVWNISTIASGSTFEFVYKGKAEGTGNIKAKVYLSYIGTKQFANYAAAPSKDEATIKVNPNPTISIDKTPNTQTLTCNVQSIKLSAMGATTYTWNGPQTGLGADLTINMSGDYTVTGIDANGCSATANVTIDKNDKQPTVSITSYKVKDASSSTAEDITTKITCENKTLYFATTTTSTVVTNELYSWSLGTSFNTNLSYTWSLDGNEISSDVIKAGVTTPGTYKVVVKDLKNGCTGSAEIIITKDESVPTIDNITTTVKEGTDASFDVTDPNRLTCDITELELEAEVSNASNNGMSYQWYTVDVTGKATAIAGETSLTYVVSTAGDYQFVATDDVTGCSTTSAIINVADDTTDPTVTLTSYTNPEGSSSASIVSTTVITCANDKLYFETTTNTTQVTDETYRWSLGGTSSEDVSYSWTLDGDAIDSKSIAEGVVTTGKYVVTVKDLANGCTSTASVELTSNTTSPAMEEIIAVTNFGEQSKNYTTSELTCAVQSLILQPQSMAEDVTCEWRKYSDESSNFTKLGTAMTQEVTEPGLYKLVIKDTNTGCKNEKSITITQNIKNPTFTKIQSATALDESSEDYKETSELTCTDKTLYLSTTVTTQNGVLYSWKFQSEGEIEYKAISSGENNDVAKPITQPITEPGIYRIVVTDKINGCVDSTDIVIKQNIIEPTITNIVSVTTLDETADNYKATKVITCDNPVLTLKPTISDNTKVSYKWSTNEDTETIEVKAAGTYKLVVTDSSNGCSSDSNITVTEDVTRPNLSIEDTYLLCPADTIGGLSLTQVLEPTPGITYTFYDEAGKPIKDVYQMSTTGAITYYSVKGEAANGCESEMAEFAVDFAQNVDFTLHVSQESVLVGAGETVVTVIPEANSDQADVYTWKANDQDLPVDGMEYAVLLYLGTEFEVTGSNRCDSKTQKASVEVTWPTAFTPYNNNGLNETFAKGLPLAVFNRFGIQIYEGQDGWDGVMNMNMGKDELAVPGVYYYAVQLPDGNVKKGTIEIVKF